MTLPALAPGAATTVSVILELAKEGDVVTLGPPPTLPVALVFSGLVSTDGKVRIRLTNTGTQAVPQTSGQWMVSAGGGPRAGEPLVVQDPRDALAPLPLPPNRPV